MSMYFLIQIIELYYCKVLEKDYNKGKTFKENCFALFCLFLEYLGLHYSKLILTCKNNTVAIDLVKVNRITPYL